MNLELQALEANKTWVLTELPPNKTPIRSKWVYRIKCKADGTLDKYKAKLVAKDITKDVYMKLPQENMPFNSSIVLVFSMLSHLLGLKRLQGFLEVTTAQSGTTAKLPILKLGEYEIWVIRIKQYFQIQDYALWDVIENEKTNKKNDVKARSLLLMALPNEHQLTFNQYPDAKTMFAAIETRFGVETMSIDDLYNNFKIVEQKVKKSIGASSGAQNLAFMTAPSTSVSTASFSDNVVYAFMVENPNGSNLLHQDLDKIHEDDLEAIDLKWQLSLLSMTAKRECKAPRSKEGQFRNQDNTKKRGNNEHTSSKAMLAIDGVGFDWSDMAEEQVQTNMALMAFLDSELNQTEFTATTYKRGLATLEEQLITYRKNEVLFSEEVTVLKREVACQDYEINMLKSEFEKVKQKKEGIEFKIEKFDKASKDLDLLLGSQITDKSKKGLGYSAVPPPHPLIYNRPNKIDLSYSGLDEFKEPEFKGYGTKNSKQDSNIVCDKKSDDSKENSNNSLVKEQVSNNTSIFVESSHNVDKETVFPVDKKMEFVKPKNHEKPVKKSVRYAEMYRSQTPRGNQRNWNGHKSNQLGSDFVMYNKACFICGSFNHVQAQCKYHQREGMVYGNTYNRVNYNYTTKRSHPNAQRNMVPRAVLMKTGLKTFNTVRTVNIAHPKSIVFSAKPIPLNAANAQAVNTARPKVVKTARLNFEVVNAVRVNQANATKASACWVWRPTKPDSASITFKKHNYIDARGKSKEVGTLRYLSLVVPLKKVGDEAVHKELGDRMERAATTASSLEAEQDSGAQTRFETTSNSPMNHLPQELTHLEVGRTVPKSTFIKEIENLVDKKVKIIRSDNGTEFKNKVMDEFCREKGIRREYSVARTPQQNGVAERRNRTLIEAARTMLADSKLPTTFWAEAGFKPAITFIETICECHVTILNTLDSLGKFDGKSDKGTQGELNVDEAHLMKNESDDKDNPEDNSSPKEANVAGQHVNTASPKVNTGRFKLNTVDPSVNTASSNDLNRPKDMFHMGARHSLEVNPCQRAIGTKWIFRNKKDKRGIVIRKQAITCCWQRQSLQGGESTLWFWQQAPRACMETWPIICGHAVFKEEKIDSGPLFIKKQKGDILLVQIYVDDIIFGSTKKEMSNEFEKLMKDNFQMRLRSCGEITFFLGYKIKQKEKDGIFIRQNSPFELVAYTDSDYDGATQDRKSTTGGYQFLGNRLISWQCKKQTMVATSTTEAEYVAAASCYGQGITATIDRKLKVLVTKASIRRHLKLEDSEGLKTLPTTEIFEQLAFMGTYPTPTFTHKLFSNMKRISKGYSGVVTPLFNTMLVQHQDEEPFHETTHESSPLRITSLPPSLSPQTHLSTSQPQTTFVAEEPALMPHESPLQSVHSLGRDEAKKVYSSALTKLILRVKKLGKQVKTSKAIRRVRIVLSKDEDAAEDSSKQGRKISKIDTHPSISLVQDGWTFMVLGDARREEPIRLWERCVEKRKDKRKAIMREDESVQKKTKKQLEQERLTRQEQEVVAKDDQAHVIDWSDPVVIRYHAQQNRPYSVAEARKNMCIYLKNQGGFKMSHFKGMSYDDIRPIFEKVWDQNQSFVPMDSEKEKGSEKKGSKKKSLARKRATEKQSEESTKRQKIENDIEKDELKAYLDLVPREEFAMEIESLAISIIIVDWKDSCPD
ncbi:ribonuclease H-like domain-containing protein [Tanacetum coccineum]